VQQVLGAPWFKVPLVGWTFCFFFHLANGVRHLAWDTGAGFDRARIVVTGWTVLALAWSLPPRSPGSRFSRGT
jgi:succinate dehydrogenase / fumarate reductase cytochrome b subunit